MQRSGWRRTTLLGRTWLSSGSGYPSFTFILCNSTCFAKFRIADLIRSQPWSGEINLDHLVPQIDRELEKWVFEFKPCIVDEGCRVFQILPRLAPREFVLGLIGDIGFNADSAASRSFNSPDCLVGSDTLVYVVDNNCCPFIGDGRCDRLPNSRVGACHNRYFVLKPQLSFLLKRTPTQNDRVIGTRPENRRVQLTVL